MTGSIVHDCTYTYIDICIVQGPRPSVSETDTDTHGMKHHNLQSLIYELQETNKALQFEVDDLKQKHKDAQGDIKVHMC